MSGEFDSDGSPKLTRAVRPDGETEDYVVLIKNVSVMRATYQVRSLAFYAYKTGRCLWLDLPEHCDIHATLSGFIKQHPELIKIVKGDA